MLGARPHPLRLSKVIGKMLVVEYGYGAAAFGTYTGDLFKEVTPRIHMPALFIPRIIAVFANQEDPIDVKCAGAGVQSLADTGVNGDVVAGRQIHADVAIEDMVQVD